MRCLIRYQLREEDTAAHHEFTADSPDTEQVIAHLTEFLHPEVIYEFLPVQHGGENSIAQLRARMAHARQYLEQYCGLQSMSYMVLPDGATSAQGKWTCVLLSTELAHAPLDKAD
ncbi:hypothetical protein [Herbaspirillum rubrisubalbicans]|uniref:Uncharacterized protein n=1 Tax=Herbaspirillum rubrisubalbicans TaxID=80842 RepID=A0AAD0U5M0_9BURK|nr:hypothetical protein [Herbaspirillum rubrisubalbicans]AYR23687.1 hypothetical protein RC54_07520 [Herbaspirillum rubrisubalbicans]